MPRPNIYTKCCSSDDNSAQTQFEFAALRQRPTLDSQTNIRGRPAIILFHDRENIFFNILNPCGAGEFIFRRYERWAE